MNSPRPITASQLHFAKPFIKWFTHLHTWLYKASGGRYFNHMGGGNICIVKMTGARSGQPREFPLMHIPYGDGIVLVASFAGAPKHPVWYYNLLAHPAFEVTADGRVERLTARLASAQEKARIWPLCCAAYADFERYRRRTDRDIPMFICAPA